MADGINPQDPHPAVPPVHRKSPPLLWGCGIILGLLLGENLLGEAMGQQNHQPVLRGLKGLHVEPGALVIEVED